MRKIILRCLNAKLFIVLTSFNVLACQGPQFHQMTLLEKLYPLMMSSPIIAKVQILGVKSDWIDGPYGRKSELVTAKAKVIEAIKGVTAGQTIEIHATPSSCGGRIYEEDTGRQAFIAGAILNITNSPFKGQFVSGRWNPQYLGIAPQ
ncbi:hypothetical protein [Methylobacterium bullatum]|uniref:hypothetical protein n=1 Tax=Methylobacterium bullatum TaxID=570505 RepID=UPI0030D19F99